MKKLFIILVNLTMKVSILFFEQEKPVEYDSKDLFMFGTIMNIIEDIHNEEPIPLTEMKITQKIFDDLIAMTKLFITPSEYCAFIGLPESFKTISEYLDCDLPDVATIELKNNHDASSYWAVDGNLRMLEYVKQNINDKTFEFALKGGNLNCMKYIIGIIDKSTLKNKIICNDYGVYAAEYKKLPIIQYILENNLTKKNSYVLFNYAYNKKRDVDILQYLFEHIEENSIKATKLILKFIDACKKNYLLYVEYLSQIILKITNKFQITVDSDDSEEEEDENHTREKNLLLDVYKICILNSNKQICEYINKVLIHITFELV